jgi:NADH dehydrogenase [ubiquinone] 1 alpha subcomplex assembly factor 7
VRKLADLLRRRIEREGPISLSDFMAAALTDPEEGYYTTRDPFGAGGDFVTAPEVSQMFGELIGLWAVAQWQAIGMPSPFALVELGPGRGTLMADALRAARVAPPFLQALDLRLVEASPKLESLQRERLLAVAPDLRASWHRNLGDVPDSPMILIANEFFDALPVKQFQMTDRGWAERLVGLAADSGDFAFVLGPSSPVNALRLPEALRHAVPDEKAEVSPAALALAAEIGRRLAESPGAALIIDYGHPRSTHAWTLQALSKHRGQDPLLDPCEADLTAFVDFETIAATAREAGGEVFGPVGQGSFLKALGIEARAERLARTASPEQKKTVEAALKRLTGPEDMGSHFKVMALAPRGAEAPAGFEDADIYL